VAAITIVGQEASVGFSKVGSGLQAVAERNS